MKHSAWLAGAAGLALAACSPQSPTPAAPTASPSATPSETSMPSGMPMPSSTAVAGPITGTGKITAIDAAAGTVTLDHEPIPAVQWGAMTMAFTTTDPAMLSGLKVGDAVSFDLKSASEPSTLSRIQKQ